MLGKKNQGDPALKCSIFYSTLIPVVTFDAFSRVSSPEMALAGVDFFSHSCLTEGETTIKLLVVVILSTPCHEFSSKNNIFPNCEESIGLTIFYRAYSTIFVDIIKAKFLYLK